MGQRSFEHLTGILENCSTRSAALRRVAWDDWTSAHDSQLLDTYDATRCARLFRRLTANGTVQVPTLTLRQRDGMSAAELVNDPRLKHVPPSERRTWEPFLERLRPAEAPLRRRYWEARLRVVGLMRRAGVPFMCGTDLGNQYIYPGFSVHDELRLLVEAGLSPLEALQACTGEPRRVPEGRGLPRSVGDRKACRPRSARCRSARRYPEHREDPGCGFERTASDAK